jgi:hypothetical protein
LRPQALERVHDFTVINLWHRLAENLRQARQRVRVTKVIGETEYERKDGMFDELVSLRSH